MIAVLVSAVAVMSQQALVWESMKLERLVGLQPLRTTADHVPEAVTKRMRLLVGVTKQCFQTGS